MTELPAVSGSTSASRKGHLLRILGVGFGIAVIVGNTVGSGILRTPGEIAGQLRSPALIMLVWSLGGVYAFFCTLAVTELGTMLPSAGGWFVYSRRAFGDYAGFVVGCSDWTVQSAALAYIAIAFGEFAAELHPALQGRVKLVAVTALVLLAGLNWVGLRTGSRTQELASLLKALALVGFVAACFAMTPGGSRPTSPAPPNPGGPSGGWLLAVLVALQAIIITYDGWYGAIYFTEEDEDPARSLPRSSVAGVLACIAIYLLVNAALLFVLPMHRLAGSQLPAAEAALAVFGGRGKQIVLVISLVTALSTINAVLLMMPRILFGMSRDGLLPSWVSAVNRGGTPSTALWLATAAAVALVLSGSFETLIAIAAFLFVCVYLSGFVALFMLRIREPELTRPFRIWGYPWSNLGVLIASLGFLVASIVDDLKHALFSLVLIALTYPIYRLVVVKMWLPQPSRRKEYVAEEVS